MGYNQELDRKGVTSEARAWMKGSDLDKLRGKEKLLGKWDYNSCTSVESENCN